MIYSIQLENFAWQTTFPGSNRLRILWNLVHLLGYEKNWNEMNLKKNYPEKLMKFDNFSTKSPTNPIQFLHALAASTVQSRQFFKSTLAEQLFEWKN